MVQGFAELEYGMLHYMGAIDDSTPIVTSGRFSLTQVVVFSLIFSILFVFLAYFQVSNDLPTE